MKVLVVYYSRTGHTERIAKEIAERCQGDIERILDGGIDRHGLYGYLRSAWESSCGATPLIQRAIRDPAEYDLVVIGTPIWNWRLAAPVRTYVRRHAGQFRHVAFFCTEGGSGDARAFDELQRAGGLPARATMAIKERELDPMVHEERMRDFLAKLAA